MSGLHQDDKAESGRVRATAQSMGAVPAETPDEAASRNTAASAGLMEGSMAFQRCRIFGTCVHLTICAIRAFPLRCCLGTTLIHGEYLLSPCRQLQQQLKKTHQQRGDLFHHPHVPKKLSGYLRAVHCKTTW